MSVSQPVLLTQSLLWNRALDGPSRPQPVVVLLGPVGSGKSTALTSISEACGAEVVHALIDFHQAAPAAAEPTTVETLTRVAFGLSRSWKARPRARFTRFTLGLIAVQAPLAGQSHDEARQTLRDLIEKFTRIPRMERFIAGLLDTLADSLRRAGVLPTLPAEIAKTLLLQLIRSVARWPVGKAKRWHANMPEAQGATALDALVSLHAKSAEEITKWLAAAFLADVRESQPRMATPDRFSQCSCPNNRARHWHNWVLLLDNIDEPGGTKFITDLLAARGRHLRQHPDEHDPLLVIATSGRWDPHWETEWLAPWRSPSENIGRARPVPRCQEANYGHWAGQASEAHAPPYYLVLLEALTIDETAEILGISPYAPECVLAQHATGGLPAAVHLLKGTLRDRQLPLQPGAREVLEPADGAWRKRLADLRLDQHLRPDIRIDEFVTAAPFATAPWLIPPNATSLISRPHVGRILTELRTALWSIAPKQGGATPNYGELHPWLARTLLSALARNGTSYAEEFEALLNDPDTLGDPVRKAYCQLALGRISEVVDAFEASFDQRPHQEWIDRLELVTRAPDNQPLSDSCWELYEQLAPMNASRAPHGLPSARSIIARLITARWLAANPFAVPDEDLCGIIRDAYGKYLSLLSNRPDLTPLTRAAQLICSETEWTRP